MTSLLHFAPRDVEVTLQYRLNQNLSFLFMMFLISRKVLLLVISHREHLTRYNDESHPAFECTSPLPIPCFPSHWSPVPAQQQRERLPRGVAPESSLPVPRKAEPEQLQVRHVSQQQVLSQGQRQEQETVQGQVAVHVRLRVQVQVRVAVHGRVRGRAQMRIQGQLWL